MENISPNNTEGHMKCKSKKQITTKTHPHNIFMYKHKQFGVKCKLFSESAYVCVW